MDKVPSGSREPAKVINLGDLLRRSVKAGQLYSRPSNDLTRRFLPSRRSACQREGAEDARSSMKEEEKGIAAKRRCCSRARYARSRRVDPKGYWRMRSRLRLSSCSQIFRTLLDVDVAVPFDTISLSLRLVQGRLWQRGLEEPLASLSILYGTPSALSISACSTVRSTR
jgi:hypothetical protein